MAPYKEYTDEDLKVYYSISEVAWQFDVATSLLRYWEKEFEQLHPKRNKLRNRQYTKKDIAVVKQIYHLVKERGFTVWGAKKELINGKTDFN